MAKNLFLQSPDAGDISELFNTGAANIAAMGLSPQPAQAVAPRQSSAGFDSAVARVLQHEGGYTPSDGNTGAPANFGINQKHNPDLDVKNITQDQAIQRYKTNYWDAIGGDSLPPELQGTALDASVNQGPGNAMKWLRESGGDVRKFNELRRQHYEALAQKPEFSRYRDAWLKRLGSYEQQTKPDAGFDTSRYEPLTDDEAAKLQQKQQPKIDTSRYELLSDEEVQRLPASMSMPKEMRPKQEDVGFFERLPQVAKTGWENMNRSLDVSRAVLADDFNPQTVDLIASNIQAQIEQAKKDQGRMHASERELKQAIEEFGKTEGWGDSTKGFFSLLGTAAMNPKGVALGTVEQLSNMLPSFAGAAGGAAAGAGVGAAAGSVIPGAGTAAGAAVGGVWGSRAGLAAGTAALEFGNEITEAITSRLEKQGKQPTKENIAALLADPQVQADVKKQAAAKGLTLAAVDALTMGVAGKIGARGVEAAKAGRRGASVGYGAGAVGTELIGEPAGEAASQAVARGEVNKGDVAAELIYGAGSAAGSAAIGTAGQVVRDRVQGHQPAQPAPRQEPIIDVTYTDAQGNTVTEVSTGAAPAPSGPIGRAIEKATPKQTVIVDDEGNRVVLDTSGEQITLTPEQPDVQESAQPAADGQAPTQEEFEAQFSGIPATENEAVSAQKEPYSGVNQPEAVTQQAPEATENAANAGDETAQNALQVVDNIENQPGTEIADRPLTEWSEQELRDRLRYVTQQAKANNGWDARLLNERARVSKEINSRNTGAKNDQQPAATAVPDANVAPASNQAAAQVAGDQPARSAPAEVDAVRADGGQASTGATGLPVGKVVSGADAAAQPDAALTRDKFAGRWFGSEEKAQAFAAKQGAQDTHEVVKTGKVRWELKPKAKQDGGKADMAAIIENVRKQDAETAAKIARDNEVARKRDGNVVIKDGKVYTLSYIPKAENGRRPIPADRIHAEFPDSGMILALDPSGVDLNAPYAQTLINQAKERGFKVEGDGAPVVREGQKTEQAAQQPASADADLDAMFDEAVATKKQADAQAVPEDVLKEMGLLREFAGRWKYKFNINDTKDYFANSKEDAVERATEAYNKAKPEDRLTREQRNAKADEELFKQLDRNYGRMSMEQLQAEYEKLGGDIADLQRAGRNEFNGQGGRRTSAAVANEGARGAGEARLRLGIYMKMRAERDAQSAPEATAKPVAKKPSKAAAKKAKPAKTESAKKSRKENAVTINYGGSYLSVDLGKPAHEATLSEVREAVRSKGLAGHKDIALKMFERDHLNAVNEAIAEGKSVPDAVLADYTSLIRSDLTEDQRDQMNDDLAGLQGAERADAIRNWGKKTEAAKAAESLPAEEAQKPSSDYAEVIQRAIQEIIPQAQRYERSFGRSQWPGYIKNTLIARNDYLKVFVKSPIAGDMAKIKIALTKAGDSKDLEAIVKKIDAVRAARKDDAPTVSESLTSAAKNTAAGLTAAIDGLGELFGGTGKLNSGLTFDEEAYAKAKPLFKQAISHLGEAGRDLRQAMQAIVNMVMDKFGEETMQRMRPYVVQFVKDVRDGTEQVGQEIGATDSANVSAGIEFEDEVTGAYSGQTNHTMAAKVGGEVVGTLEYTVYDGKPAISMISVPDGQRRKGYGAELVMQLQRSFPDTEIDWGGMTDDGAALRKSLEFKSVPGELAEKFDRLDAAKRERDALLAKADEFQKIENPTDKQRSAYYEAVAPLNDLHDEIGDLESELYGEKPYKQIVIGRKKTKPAETAPASLKNRAAALAKQFAKAKDGQMALSIDAAEAKDGSDALRFFSVDADGNKVGLTQVVRANQSDEALQGLLERFAQDVAVANERKSRVPTPESEIARAPKDMRFSVDDERNLIVAHNLSESNLLHAASLGGLPVPSLAITKVDAPLDGFGEITLIGDTELATPSAKNPVFDADVYSPRFPSVKVKVNEAAVRKALEPLQKAAEAKGQRMRDSWYAIEDMQRNKLGTAISSLSYDTGARLGYAAAILGKDLSVPMKSEQVSAPATGLMSDARFAIKVASMDLSTLEPGTQESKSLAKALNSAQMRLVQAMLGDKMNTEDGFKKWVGGVSRRLSMYGSDTTIDDDGVAVLNDLSRAGITRIKDLAKNSAAPAQSQSRETVDFDALRNMLDREVPREQMEAWLHEQLSPAMGERRIIKDNGTTGAYTMANIVREMTRKVRDAEGFNYGLGNARSKGATKFKKLAQIQSQRDRVVSGEEFEAARKEIEEEFDRLIEKVEPYKTYERENTTELLAEAIGESYSKQVGRALEDVGLKGVPADVQKQIGEFAAALAGAPTEYFEAKPQRAVEFSEFKGAVVPSSLSAEARAVLEDAGLTLREYDATDKQSRSKAVQALADELDAKTGDIRFSVEDSFGPVTTEYREDPKGAIEWLKKGQTGEAIVNHPTLGEISLIWGDGNMGLSHIARRHGEQMLDRIPALLKETETYTKPKQNGRVFLGNATNEATIRLDWNGKEKIWLVSAYEKYGDAKPKASAQQQAPRTSRLDAKTLRSEVTAGVLGKIVDQLIESGEITIHETAKTLPEGARGVRGVNALTMPDGKIHMVAGNIARGSGQAVLLHEMFHRGGQSVLGTKEWGNLMGDLGSLYRQANMTSGKLNAIYKRAAERVNSARARGAVSTGMTVEEFGAYAIEEYSRAPDSLPAALRKWVEDFLGFVKAHIRKTYGKQIGELTPAQVAAFAKMAIMNRAVDLAMEGRFSAALDQTQTDAFKRWFGDSKVVDTDGKPLVVYHGTGADFSVFDENATAAHWKMDGFYFAPDPADASRFAESSAKIKQNRLGNAFRPDGANVMPVYLSLQNPKIIEFGRRGQGGFVTADEMREMLAEAKFDGHDGAIIKGWQDGSGEVQYVAFRPEQIKSAIGNNGDFDPANPDIRYSVGEDQQDTFKPADPSRFEKFQATFQNNMNRVRKVQERIKELTGVQDLGRADYYGAETNRPGRVAARLEDAKEKMFKPLLQKLAKTEFKPADLEQLLHAQHAQERNEAIARINPDMPDGGSGMTNAEAAAILDKFKDAKDLQALASEARSIAKATLDMKRAYGLIRPEDYEALQEAYEFYVPLKGDGEYGPRVKRAMGHDAREEYILENIARDYEQAVVTGEKNLARQSLLALVAENPDPELWTLGMPPKGRYVAGQVYTIKDSTLNPKDRGNVVAQFTSQSQVNAFLEAKGAEAGRYVVEDSNGERVATFVKPLQDNEVMVYVDGQPVRIQVFDEHLAKQLRPLDQAQMGVILEGARKVNRYLASIYTGYNPYFILKNAVRDVITGTINMTGNQGAKVAAKAWKHYLQSNKAIGQWAATGKFPQGKYGEMLREYRNQGGKTGASYMSDLEAQTRNLSRIYEDAYGVKNLAKDGRVGRAAWVAGRKAISGLAHTIEIANQATENALRLSLYMALRDAGETPAKAAQAAKTVTVDFDRKGAMTPAMGALYIFFNPAVQGTANAFNTLARGKHKRQAWMAMGALATLGYFAATQGMDDDEDRWLGNPWDKRTKNFMLSFGDHTLTIPLSQEFAPAFALGTAIGEASRGVDTMKTTMRLVSSFIDAYVPFSGAVDPDSNNPAANIALAVTPTAVRPMTELAFNRNTFGTQIVPENAFNEGAPDNTKMNRATKGTPFDSASQMLAQLGEAAGEKRYENGITKVSPETLKYLWSTYTGGLGRFVTDTVGITRLGVSAPDTVSSSEVPFIKDFWQSQDVKPLRGRYYELAGDAKEAATQFRTAKKNGDANGMNDILSDPEAKQLLAMDKMFTKANKAITAIREEQVAVNANDALNLADKRRRLKELEQQEEVIYRQAMEAFRQKD